jgi:hypothetical protein
MATTPNLQRKLQQTLGAEATGDLIGWMQTMDVSRTDVADLRAAVTGLQTDMTDLRIDVGDLRREMQVGFARLDGRMDSQQERMEKLLEKGLRDQTRFFFLAWSVLLAAFIGMYAR